MAEGDDPGYTLYDLADRLRTTGWQVPAYTLTGAAADIAVQRILVRQGVSRDLASILLRRHARRHGILRSAPRHGAHDRRGSQRLQPSVTTARVTAFEASTDGNEHDAQHGDDGSRDGERQAAGAVPGQAGPDAGDEGTAADDPWYKPSPLPSRSAGSRSATHALPTPSVTRYSRRRARRGARPTPSS